MRAQRSTALSISFNPRLRAAPVQRTTASQVRNASVLATPTRSRGLLNCPRQVRSVSPSRTGGSNRLAFLANRLVAPAIRTPCRTQRNVSATPGTRRASTVDVVSTRSALRARSAGGSLPGLRDCAEGGLSDLGVREPRNSRPSMAGALQAERDECAPTQATQDSTNESIRLMRRCSRRVGRTCARQWRLLSASTTRRCVPCFPYT